jgi:hypothetical protein
VLGAVYVHEELRLFRGDRKRLEMREPALRASPCAGAGT